MLRLRQLILCSAVATLLIVGLARPAAAQRWDKKTTITTNMPVRVGNVLLPAGTYVMRLFDDPGARRIVQVFNADETKLYTTTFGMPDFRNEATDETIMTFYEADPGRMPALHTWFAPGSNFGVELRDGRGPVQQVAHAEPEPAPAEPEPAAAPAEEAAVEPAPEEAPVRIAQNESPSFVEPEAQPEPAPAPELPKTAGELPMLALTGLLSLGAALTLRRK